MWKVVIVAIVAAVAGLAELAGSYAPPVPVVQAATQTQPIEAVVTALAPETDMEQIVFNAADQYGVPRGLAKAVLTQESGGDPGSTSSVGAAGLMQVMPGTAAGIAAELGVTNYDLYDPATSAKFGMYYLAGKIKRYGVAWGLAAYNWGPAAVDGFQSRHPGMDWDTAVACCASELPGETQHYVANILSMAGQFEAMQPAPAAPAGKKCPYTDTMAIGEGSSFYSTGSGYWAGQYGGMHLGDDFVGNPGDPVYAPFDMLIEMTGEYTDPGRFGKNIQARFLSDNTLYYAGHLIDVYVSSGETVAACTVIGTLGATAGPHTHIKLAGPNAPVPCEGSPPGDGGCIDPMEYWNTH